MRKTFTILILMLLPALAFSQLRYVKGMQQAQSSFLVTPSGVGANFGYNRMILPNIIVGGSLEYERAEVGKTLYNEVRMELEGKYQFFTAWEKFFVSGIASISMDQMMRSTDIGGKINANKFIVGNAFGIEGDYFFKEKISLFMQLKQRIYYLGEPEQIITTNWGIRYNFY